MHPFFLSVAKKQLRCYLCPIYKSEGQESAGRSLLKCDRMTDVSIFIWAVFNGFNECDAPVLVPPHPTGGWEFSANYNIKGWFTFAVSVCLQ